MLAIAIGAAIGANIRWLLGIGLNSYLPHLPPGTLVANLPGASEKLEGAISAPTQVASASGSVILRPDRFFDGRVFDPSAVR